MGPLITAIRTLTILPVPGRDTSHFGLSLLWFPWVGLMLAAVLWAAYQGLAAALPGQPYLASLILVTLGTILTGALHIDGIADVCDAFGGGRTRERVLEILKDPRHGTFGVTAIVLVVLAKVITYAALIQHATLLPIAVSLVASRSAQSAALAFLPNARGEASVAAAFGVGGWVRALAIASSLAALGLLLWRAGDLHAAVPMIAGFVAAAVTAGYCARRIGGITGDCVGAVSEVAELGVLVAAVVA